MRKAGPMLVLVNALRVVLRAQEGGGRLAGMVTDSTQASIAGVALTVEHTGTQLSRAGVTDALGNFVFPALPVGVYQVTAAKPGFTTLRTTGVTVAVGLTTRLDLMLQVAAAAAEVTVEAEAALVNTESAESGVLFNSAQVTNLPLNGRNFLQLVSLQPGVRNNTNAGRQSFVVNGAPAGQGINLLVDGTDATGIETTEVGGIAMAGDRSTFTLGLDSISEFVVHASSFSVRYGRALGGVIETVTKSGTNELHGNVFHYFRNDALNANSIQANAAGLPRAPLRFNQYGANSGGPVIRNRMFFWIGYEGTRRRSGRTNTYTVLSEAGRANVTDPNMARHVAEYIPRANRAPTTNPNLALLVRNDVTPIREDIGMARLDYHLLQGDNLFFRYNIHDTFASVPLLGSPKNDNVFPSRQQLATLSWTHTFGPTATMNLRTGANRVVNITTVSGPDPRVNLAGIFNVGGSFLNNYATSWTYAGDFTFIRGKHNLSAGFEYRTIDTNRSQDGGTPFNFLGGPNQLANFFRNTPDQLEKPFNILGNSGSGGNISGYFEDSLKLSAKLNIDLGLRYDYFLRPLERHGRIVGLASDPFPISQLRFKKPGEQVIGRDLGGFGPRFGFAYAPRARVAIRGGYGIFVGLNYPSLTTAATSTYVPPMIPRELFDPDYTKPRVLFTRADLPNLSFPDVSSITRDALLRSFLPPAPNFPMPDWKNTYTQQWTMRAEGEVLKETLLAVAYIGTKSTKVIGEDVFNLPRPLAGNTRENPQLGLVTLRGSFNNAFYHSMQTTFSHRTARGMQLNAYYTWSHSIDDIFGFSDINNPGVRPQTNNRRDHRASSAFDIRHDFKADYYYELPGGARRWRTGWAIGGITRINSGSPYTALTGADVGDTTHPQRPNLVCATGRTGTAPGLFAQLLDAACFVRPAVRDPVTGYLVGNLGRNAFNGPSSVNFDFSVTKSTRLGERLTHQFRAEFFNILNNTNFDAPITSTNNPNFGRILGAAAGRQIQFAMKVVW